MWLIELRYDDEGGKYGGKIVEQVMEVMNVQGAMMVN